MATNGTHDTIQQVETPTGSAKSPYIVPSLSGEIIYIPCSKSATRLVVTGKETDNAFAVVASGGSEAAPIGFHFHREAHDVFLCLQGSINVWAGDQCRTMSPGDYASVPPGTVHQYQTLGEHSEFIGLIVPGGWEEFFRFIGESYSGPLWPMTDDRNIFEVLIPKLKAAAEKFDMVPQPHLPYFPPQPWTGEENKLPDSCEPYFLKNSSGPSYVVEATVVRPLSLPTQSNNRFSVGSIEGSSQHKSPLFTSAKSITFDVHHCVQVSIGKMEFTVGGASATLSAYETLFIPAGTGFSFKFSSRMAKAYVFSNGGGIVELLCKLGQEYKSPIIPEKEMNGASDVSKFEKELGYSLS